MKRSRTLVIFISVCVFVFGYLTSSVVQANTNLVPGSANDPLVTKSYLEKQQYNIENQKFTGETVIIARNDDARDAMAASAIVSKLRATILYTEAKSPNLNPDTKSKLSSLKPQRVILIGGTGVLTEAVEKELINMFGTDKVIRLAGTNSVRTAIEITNYVIGQ